jgi:hypothetical protein
MFAPDDLSVAIDGSDLTGQDFTAVPSTPYHQWAAATITNGMTNAMQDADGDGVFNEAEWVMDSDPMLSNAAFAASMISFDINAVVYFESSTRRMYSLQYRDDLLTGVWAGVAGCTNVRGAGFTNLTDPAVTLTNRFYRLKVAVP